MAALSNDTVPYSFVYEIAPLVVSFHILDWPRQEQKLLETKFNLKLLLVSHFLTNCTNNSKANATVEKRMN
jgi:hypothetical protein